MVVLAARAAGGRPPDPVPRLAALAPPATVIAAGAVAAAAVARWWLALVFAVPAVILLCWQLPPAWRWHGPPGTGGDLGSAEAEGTVVLRVLTLNVLVARADPEAIMAKLREHRVDVFAVQELTPEMVTSLEAAGISALLPFSELDARPSSLGTGIWTRLPLDPLPPIAGLSTAAPRAHIHPCRGVAVQVSVVHPKAPTGGKEQRWLADLELLRQMVAGVSEPQVVAGDFNATRDHQPFRAVLKEGLLDCADAARKRSWPAFTWPNWRSLPPLMRLDHILVSSQHFSVQQARVVRVPGTDHRGVLAVVTLRLPAP
jgi:endonuclease/exonuclease/phosphatase (EEP) superfamily protein YafD